MRANGMVTSVQRINFLKENTEYQFKCVNRIINNRCDNEQNEEITTGITYHSSVCPNFRVEIDTRTSNSLELTWDNDADLDYKIQYRQCDTGNNFSTYTRTVGQQQRVEWITEPEINSITVLNLGSATCYEFSMRSRGKVSLYELSVNCKPYEFTKPTPPFISCRNARQYSNSLSVSYGKNR